MPALQGPRGEVRGLQPNHLPLRQSLRLRLLSGTASTEPLRSLPGEDAYPLFDGQEEGQEEIDEEEEEEQAKRTRRRREKRGWLCGFLLKCTELGPAARAKSPLSKACVCS